MKEVGYDLRVHHSKGLNQLPTTTFDYVITMGCGDDCPWIPASVRDDWPLPDPKAMPPEQFNTVRDEVERRVRRLIEQIEQVEASV
jgi:protein-tyrosine-phosphatase